jgi:hypothetical protein
MEIIFNELSLSPDNLPQTHREADQAMLEWLELLVILRNKTKDIKILSSISVKEHRISPQLFLMDWVKQNLKGVHRDSVTLFLGLLTKDPIKHDYPYYLFNGTACQGFAYAQETNGISMSYFGAYWKDTAYTLQRQAIDEINDTYEETAITVRHIGLKEHITAHQPYFDEVIIALPLLSNKKRFIRTGKTYKGAMIYKDCQTGYYWYYDTFHYDRQDSDKQSPIEIEVCDAQGNHIGTADAKTGELNRENCVKGRSISEFVN